MKRLWAWFIGLFNRKYVQPTKEGISPAVFDGVNDYVSFWKVEWQNQQMQAEEIGRLRREVFNAQMRALIAHEALTTIRDGSVNMGVEEFANLCMDIAAKALKEMDGE